MKDKRIREVINKLKKGNESLTFSEARELGLIESEPSKTLTPEKRRRCFEKACELLGTKPSQIIGSMENKP
jgi:hypothetical protein